MVQEFHDRGKYSSEVEEAIATILTDKKPLDFQNIDTHRREWVEGIIAYQQTKGLSPANGVIDHDRDTYNRLKEDVQKQLTPSNP